MENKGYLYFVGGIEGVGKTSITTLIAEMLPRTLQLTASKVIRSKSNNASLGSLSFRDQSQLVIQGVKDAVQSGNHRILLDSHYLCFGETEIYQSIADDYWNNVTAFVHLASSPESIYLRSMRDELNGVKQRDLNGVPQQESIEEILRRQDLSINEAIYVSNFLKKPYISVYNDSPLAITTLNLIKSMLNLEVSL